MMPQGKREVLLTVFFYLLKLIFKSNIGILYICCKKSILLFSLYPY